MKKFGILMVAVLCAFCVLTACDTGGDSVTVTFVTNWDELTIAPIRLTLDTDSYMPEIPEREGYEFKGWFLDQLFINPFRVSHAIVEDITLYAKWEKLPIVDPPVVDPPIIVPSGGFTYELIKKDNTEYYAVTGYLGKEKTASIPETYGGSIKVKGIAADAFRNNTVLEKISFGLEINSIGDYAFRGCVNLKEISVYGGNPVYLSENGVLYNYGKTSLLVVPAGNTLTEYTLPKTVNNVKSYAFEGCSFAMSFPATESAYTQITAYAFSGFAGKVVLNSTVKDILNNAFHGAKCEVVFDASCQLNSLKTGAFAGYAGASLTVPATVASMDGHVFNGCTAVVDIRQSALTALPSNAFAGYKGATLFIPAAIETLGGSCFYESTATITFAENSQITMIVENTFGLFEGNVTLPPSVKTILDNAFWQAKAQAVVNIPNLKSEMTLGADAFNGSKAQVNWKTV